jgi:butyryl-CoA dehydrogenase
LSFDKVKVSKGNILGQIGEGGKIALNILNLGRLKLGIGAVGSAKLAMKSAVQYAMERKQFKRPICEFGLIQQKIAMMASGIYAGECMTMRTAGHCAAAIEAMPDESGPTAKLKVLEEFLVECAIEKVYQSEMLDRVVDETVQIYGGYGFISEYPAERYYRDARISRIYEGTNEINRLVIAGTILKRTAQGRLALLRAAQETVEAVTNGKFVLPEFDGPLADMRQRVWQAKRTLHLVVTAFVDGMGEKITDQAAITDQQECLGWIADIVMEVYALESTLLRSCKMIDASGAEKADLPVALMRYHAHRASRTIMVQAENVIATIADPRETERLMGSLAKLNPYRPLNLRDCGRRIARAVIEASGELIA